MNRNCRVHVCATEGETIGFDPRHFREQDSRALSLLHGKTENFKLLWSNITSMQPCSAESRMVRVVHCKLKSCLHPCMLDQGDSSFRTS